MFQTIYNNKKVLITGNTGFKGSWLCEILLLLGAKIVGVSLEPNTTPSLFHQIEIENRIINKSNSYRIKSTRTDCS